MKIGVIGSGNMGRALGVRLARLGYEVLFGARRIEQARNAAQRAGHDAGAGTNEAAAAFGEVLIWTMREPNPAAVLSDPGLLDGKIVIDLNNRDYGVEVRSGAWFQMSIAEGLQAAAPLARVVKAFNTIAMETFDTSEQALRAAGAQSFLAGADADAKRIVGKIAGDLGFEAIDLGSSVAAYRAAEALGDVIRLLMIDGGHGGRAHLTLTRLPTPNGEDIGPRGESRYG